MCDSKFDKVIIARGDAPDMYENSGYLAQVDKKKASILNFSHCSCFDTEESSEILWSGTIKSLISMAKRKADPNMPRRKANTDDFDYCRLSDMYDTVLKWAKKNKYI